MIVSCLLLVIKTVVGLALAYLIILTILHVKAMWRLRFYESQGAVVFPGARRFFFGNTLDYMEYVSARSGPEVVRGPQAWLMFEYFPQIMGLTAKGE